jgi:hypothetical protein
MRHSFLSLSNSCISFQRWDKPAFGDVCAHEEDDEAEEKPLLDLSSDEMDQHKAGMYAIFKKTYRWMWKSRFW